MLGGGGGEGEAGRTCTDRGNVIRRHQSPSVFSSGVIRRHPASSGAIGPAPTTATSSGWAVGLSVNSSVSYLMMMDAISDDDRTHWHSMRINSSVSYLMMDTIHANQWHSMKIISALNGNQWHSAAINGTLTLIREAISGHQWHSPGARIDEARGDLHLEGVIQTRLVACNASVDALGRARLCLIKQERICEEGARHRDEICISVGQNLLGDLGRIDAVRRHERNLHPVGILAQLPCHPTDEGCNQSQSACNQPKLLASSAPN